MLNFDTIISETDLKGTLPLEGGQGVRIGTKIGSDPSEVIRIMDTWCYRIDRLIELDVELNGKNTVRSSILLAHRGCTYSEFRDVYRNIDPENYEHYPAFFAFDLQTADDRERHIEQHPNSLERYMYLLREKFNPGLVGYIERMFGDSQEKKIPLGEFGHGWIMGGTGCGKSGVVEHIIYDIQIESKQGIEMV